MFLIDYSTYSKNIKKQIQKTNIDVKIKNFDECKIEEIMSRTTKHEMKVHVKIKQKCNEYKIKKKMLRITIEMTNRLET